MATALFLDRDGVINIEKEGSYIFSPEEFVFYDGALQALGQLSRLYDYTFVVTNQRGIGRGFMTELQLHEIHDHLTFQVEQAGGKIDAIYFAPALHNEDPMRKPNTGMALAAQQHFPDIEFDRSVMVGNNLSDMQFGKSMGMKTVFLHTTQAAIALPHDLIDLQFASLSAYADTFNGDIK